MAETIKQDGSSQQQRHPQGSSVRNLAVATATARPLKEASRVADPHALPNYGTFEDTDTILEEINLNEEPKVAGSNSKVTTAKKVMAVIMGVFCLTGIILTAVAMKGHFGQNFLSNRTGVALAFLIPASVGLIGSIDYLTPDFDKEVIKGISPFE